MMKTRWILLVAAAGVALGASLSTPAEQIISSSMPRIAGGVELSRVQDGFDRAASRTPAAIGAIKCNLIDADGTVGGMQATCGIDVLDANGELMSDPQYDVREKGNAAVQAAAVSFLNAVRAQATLEILPQRPQP